MRHVSAEQALQKSLRSGARIFIHGGQMMPTILVQKLAQMSDDYKNLEVTHLHIEGDLPYINKEHINVNNLFVGSNTRRTLSLGTGSYIPVGLSLIPKMLREKRLPLDIALISVSMPDENGQVTLGTSVDIAYAAVESANVVIAQINECIPMTRSPKLNIKDFNYTVWANCPILPHKQPIPDEKQKEIGRIVAENIEDGSVLQLGIGAISSIIATHLTNHKNLTVHSEMITDTVVPLVEDGVINGYNNTWKPNTPVITSFAICGGKLLDAVRNNRDYVFVQIDRTNDIQNIRLQKKFCAINNIIEADITGNTCCDTIGNHQYSGIGGQHDFAHAAMYCEKGQSFLCTKASTIDNKPRIVGSLQPGAGSTVPRHLVDAIVTEHGIARLHGLNLHQRIREMIRIAAPENRDWLESQANFLYQYKTNVFISHNI